MAAPAPSTLTSSPPFTAIADSASMPSLSTPPFQLPSSVSLDSHPRLNGSEQDPLVLATTSANQSPSQPQSPDVDPQILEALRSKDRIYVLKLGELMEGLIRDHRTRIDLTPSTSYQRLLVHRCSAFYKLLPESDPATKAIIVSQTPESRIPARRLYDLVPAESTAHPAFKIMRRSLPDRRSNRAQSQAGSVAGEDAELSDVEPSESGSLGGRSNTTGGSNKSNKKRLTIEEREAAYNEARSRIFMGFEEKEKEKDMNASSASTSGGGGSVASDLDETASSPVTESEYSGPAVRDKKHLTRNTSASSSRSLRSARSSRAPSPSFQYATIYEPSQGVYDPSQPHYPSHQYLYPQPPNPYFGGYPYYPHYNPYAPPPPQHSASDPSTPSSGEMYMSPPYGHSYGWPHPQQSPPHMQHGHPSQLPPPHHAPPPVHIPPYPPYLAPHQYGYPMPAYYPPPVDSPPTSGANQIAYEAPVPHPVMTNPVNNNSAPTIGGNGRNGSIPTSSTHGNGNGRRHHNHNGVNGGKGWGAPPMGQGRAAWSYGPGVGQGGHVSAPASVTLDTIGPRLTTRKASTTSSVNSRSSNSDDVSSTASSSTTSSSSRRTYTSTTSSQHPLPPRPDWAVGLKPQPTLHATQSSRHHDHSHHNSHNNSRTMSPISAPRNLNGSSASPHSQNTSTSATSPSALHHNNQPAASQGKPPPVPLQSTTDFPPLSATVSVTTPEKRTPVLISGAWSSGSANRSLRMSVAQHGSHLSNAVADGSEESDRGFERPPPKSSELFNPKVLRRPVPAGKVQAPSEKGPEKGGDVGSTLAEQVEAMSLEGQSASVELTRGKESSAVV